MNMNINNAYGISITLVTIAIVYTVFIKPYLVKNKVLTMEQLELIDYACTKGVEYAEQVYKTNPTVDRKQLAIHYAFDVVKKAGIIPDNYIDVIKGMIEAYVLKLPKTFE